MAPPQQLDVPWLEAPPDAAYSDAFRNNIKQFLSEHGKQVKLRGLKNINAWLIPLYVSPGSPPLLLHVYEATHHDAAGKASDCDQCRNMGEQTS